MGNWGTTGGTTVPIELFNVVKNLTPKAKQAMYAAASKQTINKGTWDDCAFNAAGDTLGDMNINSYEAAAEVFDMDVADVQHFIEVWDSTDRTTHGTAALKATLDYVGLFTEVGDPSIVEPTPLPNGTVVLAVRIFTSAETKNREAFEALMEANNVELTDEACELLGTC